MSCTPSPGGVLIFQEQKYTDEPKPGRQQQSAKEIANWWQSKCALSANQLIVVVSQTPGTVEGK